MVARSRFLRMRAHSRPTRWCALCRSTYTKMPFSITLRPCLADSRISAAGEPDALGQAILFQIKTHSIVPRVGHVGQPVGHSQDEEQSDVDSE